MMLKAICFLTGLPIVGIPVLAAIMVDTPTGLSFLGEILFRIFAFAVVLLITSPIWLTFILGWRAVFGRYVPREDNGTTWFFFWF